MAYAYGLLLTWAQNGFESLYTVPVLNNGIPRPGATTPAQMRSHYLMEITSIPVFQAFFQYVQYFRLFFK